jgi:DNA polymerase-3 subunit alpha
MGVKVLPPDVNESRLRFAAVGEDIRFGMGAIRNVGDNVVDGIIKARKEKGRFTDFNDFLRKIPLACCNKRVIESLIKAGAFDSLNHERKGLMICHEQGVDSVIDLKKNEANGQDSLFGAFDDDAADSTDEFNITIPPGEWDKPVLLSFEREMLGLYVSSHPLDGAERVLERGRDIGIAELLDTGGPHGSIRISGIITSVDKKVTKQGNVWALVTIEDHDAAIEVACFPATFQLYNDVLIPDSIVSIIGKVRKQETNDGSVTVSFNAEGIELLDTTDLPANGKEPVVIVLREDRIELPLVLELKRILQEHKGENPVHLKISKPSGRRHMLVELPNFNVQPDPSLFGDIKSLLGAGALAR